MRVRGHAQECRRLPLISAALKVLQLESDIQVIPFYSVGYMLEITKVLLLKVLTFQIV